MRSLRALSAVTVVAVLLLTASFAAYAHTATYATKLDIDHSRTCCGWPTVYIRGHLRSPRAACQAHSTVKLVMIGVGVLGATETNAEGRYAFAVGNGPGSGGTWRVKFPGKVLRAVDPHHHACERSASPRLEL